MSNELNGYKLGGYLIVAENEDEAVEMYVRETEHDPLGNIESVNLDECFAYFDINIIMSDDIEHIYDKRYPNYPYKDIVKASLKRPYARKYLTNGFFDQKSISAITI